MSDLQQMKTQALEEITGAADAAALEELRIKYLGKKGLVPGLMAQLGSLPKEEKPAFGQGVNILKKEVAAAIKEAKGRLGDGKAKAGPKTDITLPGRPQQVGGVHPITRVRREMIEVCLLYTSPSPRDTA